MSMQSVSDVLENHYPLFLSYSEIIKDLKISKRSMFRALKRLIERGEIEYTIGWSKNNKARWERHYRARRE